MDFDGAVDVDTVKPDAPVDNTMAFASLGFKDLQERLEVILPVGDTKEAAMSALGKAKEYARMSIDGH